MIPKHNHPSNLSHGQSAGGGSDDNANSDDDDRTSLITIIVITHLGKIALIQNATNIKLFNFSKHCAFSHTLLECDL